MRTSGRWMAIEKGEKIVIDYDLAYLSILNFIFHM